jgi:hypothetical protein
LQAYVGQLVHCWEDARRLLGGRYERQREHGNLRRHGEALRAKTLLSFGPIYHGPETPHLR